MTSRSKAKGTAYETQCVRYLRRKLDDDRIERRALHGDRDMGDIFNLVAHGHSGIVECKCHKRYGPSDLLKWKMQTVSERENAGADFALLVVHEPGMGERSFGRNSCHMQIRDLDMIQGHESFVRDPNDAFVDTWVRMDLETACDLMMREPMLDRIIGSNYGRES